MDVHRSRIGWAAVGVASLSAVLAILTLVWPEWIEALFRVEPDAGSGAAEWGIVSCLLVLALGSGAFARSELRDVVPDKPQTGGGR